MIGSTIALAILAYGAPAPTEHAVAMIAPRRMLVDDAPAQVLCTAVLVSERAMLTAGHCVDDYGRGTLELRFGPSLDAPAQSRGATEVVLHPEYSATSSAYDLAVVWLDAPVSYPPLPVHPGAPAAAWRGRPLRTLGFATAERREGHVVLAALDEDTLTYEPAPDMTCRGDSGGPVLATIDGLEQVVGITSAGDRACEAWGTAAQVDEGVAELLAWAPEPPPRAIEANAICAELCTSDEPCPGDLLCTDAGQCAVQGLEAGDLVDACTSHADCDAGPCVVLGAAARCLEPCASGLSDVPATAGGCTMAGGRSVDPWPGPEPFGWRHSWFLVPIARRRGARPSSGRHARRDVSSRS